MINTYTNKKDTVEATKWDGKNRYEIEFLVEKENMEYNFFSNKEPELFIKKDGKEEKININDYVVLYNNDDIKIFNEKDFENNFIKL